MKGDLTLKLLETIIESTGNALDVMAAVLNAGYGASTRKIEYELRRRRRLKNNAHDAVARRAAQRYYNLLSYLKRDGLLEENIRASGKLLSLTKKGLERLALLKARQKSKLPELKYETRKNDVFIIVSFDVPERERRKRDWLREALKHLGLILVQKSVWMGKVKIPKEFLDDLRRLSLAEYVEIFEINKTGSLAHLI